MSTLRSQLKQHTQLAHDKLEASYPLCDLQKSASLEIYIDNLKLLYQWHQVIESSFRSHLNQPEFSQYNLGHLSEHIIGELSELNVDFKPLAELCSKQLFQEQSIYSNHAYFMGWLYVALGSSMGAKVLDKQLSKASFYNQLIQPYYAKMAAYSQHWQAYLAHLEQSDLQGRIDLSLLLKGANDAFALLQRIQKQLYQ